jgi:hypothetical protein
MATIISEMSVVGGSAKTLWTFRIALFPGKNNHDMAPFLKLGRNNADDVRNNVRGLWKK